MEVSNAKIEQRTNRIKEPLNQIKNKISEYVKRNGGNPSTDTYLPSGVDGRQKERDSLSQIQLLADDILTLCVFMESLPTAEPIGNTTKKELHTDYKTDADFMWRWIRWLKHHTGTTEESSMPSKPSRLPEGKITDAILETETIVTDVWQHNQRQLRERQELLQINMDRQMEIDRLMKVVESNHDLKRTYSEIVKLNTKNKKLQDQVDGMKKRLLDLERQLVKANEEKEYWINRMSSVAGSKLRDNNPEITDLSDPNRAQKLSDRFAELYDNYWTNAFEELRCKFDENTSIAKLIGITKNCYSKCCENAWLQMSQLQQLTFNGTLANGDPENSEQNVKEQADIEKQNGEAFRYSLSVLKDARKRAAVLALPHIVKEVSATLQTSLEVEKELQPIQSFIKECAGICWGMAVQDPALDLFWPEQCRGSKIDKQLFTCYTKSGEQLDFVVWPAVRLHKDGALLRKGVVQPI